METYYYSDDDDSAYIDIPETRYPDNSSLTVPGIISRRSSDTGSNAEPEEIAVKDIVQIVCSPKMKYVATTYKFRYGSSTNTNDSQDGGEKKDKTDMYDEGGKIREATLWLVNKSAEKKLKWVSAIKGHQIKEPKPVLWAVSDDKYIVFKTNYFYYNFELFDAKGARIDLFFPNPRNFVNQLAFVPDGDHNNLVVALTEPMHQIYVFKLKNREWFLYNKYELSYFCDAFITIEGKLILFDDQIFQLTKWNVKDLKFETNCMIDWCYKVRLVEINQGGELLAVYAVYLQEETPKKSRIYIYSLRSGINIAFHDYDEKIVVDCIYFIAYEAGERLLIKSHNQFNEERYIDLMDPFNLKKPVSAKKLFESDVQIRDPYIIKSDKESDNAIGIIDENLDIYDLVKPSNWIEYIRKELGDYNRIYVLSDCEYIANMIKDELKGKYFNGSEVPPEESDEYPFQGSFLTWNLHYKKQGNRPGYQVEIEAQIYDQNNNSWRPVEGESKRSINPNFQPPEHTKKLKIMKCKCLANDDLLMLTNFGILVWTVHPQKGVRLHCYWGRARIRNEKRFNLYLGNPVENPFKLLDDYISDKFFIINYGSTLMETFLFLKEDELVEKFCKQCYDITFSSEGLRSTSDIQLLSIIIEFFPQLLRRHPIYLARFLSQTAFVMPLADPDMILDSEIVSLLPTQHLYHFGTYNQPSTKTSLIDTFVSNITFYWNKLMHRSKQEMDISQPSVTHNKAIPDSEATSGEWKGFEKPVFSQILLKAVQAEELETSDEKASIDELKDEIKDLKEKLMKFINSNRRDEQAT
ncbi:8486_t:CDS:2 [Dentiscutata erythropus]|uniref:8486_t:CDS:1 n=1 Tax=Dentiscutata erythropus TaxID=1348616 RepID=A0A9N9HX81_9GLOM|nr:8486_t:CDS:2 [Dentiscutata erythropus]